MYRFLLSAKRDLQLSDLRIALFNYLCAIQNHTSFVIYIDADISTHSHEEIAKKLEMLMLCGIHYSQVIYQHDNLKFHRQFATRLLMEKKAFACFCTPQVNRDNSHSPYNGRCKTLSDAEVLNTEAPFVVRISKPEKAVAFEDTIAGKQTFLPDDIDDFEIMHTDKTATVLFARATDDMMYDIDAVIRQHDEGIDTAREVLIHHYFGYHKTIRYTHLPPLLTACTEGEPTLYNPALHSLLDEGFLPEAISNYLILTGLQTTPAEVFTTQEAGTWFAPDSFTEEAVIFDYDLLCHLNCEHIRRMDNRELSTHIGYSSEDIGALARYYTQHVATLQEIKAKIDKIFAPKSCAEDSEAFKELKNIAISAPFFKEFDDFMSYLVSRSKLDTEKVSRILGVMLTGEQNGPKPEDIYPYIRNYLGEIIK